MWDSLVISSLLSILQVSVKNLQKKRALRDKLRIVRDTINMLYLDDPDF